MKKVNTTTSSKVVAYNRKRNKTELKNLAISASIAIEFMKPHVNMTAKEIHENIGGISKAQAAWAMKKGEQRGFFKRYYNKKARRFEYVLTDELI